MDANARRRRLGPVVLAVAIFISPFLAALFRIEAGLGLMAIALTVTAWLLREALEGAPEGAHRPLQLVVALNIAMALVCAAALVFLLVTR
jgi:hypothetical protein